MRRLVLRNFQSPGDAVMLTAAVRDLHRLYPGRFVTDVRSPFPALWVNNPFVSTLDEDAPGVEVIDCHYPLIHRSNFAPVHFIHGFIEYLNDQLDLRIRPTDFKGDIYLSASEKTQPSQVARITGSNEPFWILVAGGKTDFTIKWWSHTRFQEVVDYFHGRIRFVQVGRRVDYHPPIDAVLDLRGQTDLRDLIVLVYHAQGVLCPVSLCMHLAAAVEVASGSPRNRPCVVVAGGREPPNWEAYPHHRFLHTVGALRCCDQGGCWKSRTVPLNDGDANDLPENLCVDVRGNLPRCMDMIRATDVIRSIESYFEGGAISYLAN
jgi:ADP-heptose:LPS heptosyltransferase